MTLQKFKELYDKAIPGLWEAIYPNVDDGDIRVQVYHANKRTVLHDVDSVAWKLSDKDAEFIAAARNVLPELIRRLEIAEEALRVACDCPNSGFACVVCMAYETIRKDLP